MNKTLKIVAMSFFGFIMMAIGATLSLAVTTEAEPERNSPTGLQTQAVTITLTATRAEALPSPTPQASPSPTNTLKPPPTFAPPTLTPTPSLTPTMTPTATVDSSLVIPGLYGAETPTPTTTPGCVPREDWKLRYEVKIGDALASIATKYNSTVDELVAANCIKDRNLITVGQQLRVPGADHPYEPPVECVPFEVLTPFNGTTQVAADGNITFNWRGPLASKNLIRLYAPDGTIYERLVELRQNEVINASEHLKAGGTYTWYVYPLGNHYEQICFEGGPWTFTKEASQF